MAERQAPKELEVFRGFAAVCGLCVETSSIEKRNPPEPDILCRLEGGEPLAFEMVWLVDQEKIAKRLGDKEKLERHLEQTTGALPECLRDQLQSLIGNARILIRMRPSKSLASRKVVAGKIVEILLTVDREFQGNLILPADIAKIASVEIRRGRRHRYIFDVDAASHFKPVPLDAINKKFEIHYESYAPIELLAYFDLLEAPPQSELRKLRNLIEERLPSSCFGRAWVFDATAQRICYQITGRKQTERSLIITSS